ncbi:MAG: phospholipase D family protein [Vicinamibacteria bacterium]|nr:phospholipase D family protein [Thermoanaerobaculia bacterium]MBP9946110.1 phospholipase D family protein [Vicinamibacteria bacterium]
MRCLVRISKRIIVCFVGALLILVAIGWRSRLPSLEGRTTSSVLLDTAGTRIGQSITPLIEAHPGLSGIYPLEDSRNAFAARALLAAFAERTLDVQYYIWQHDMTGTLLFEALHAAADRGVRVRFLLDDNTTQGLDPILVALDSHPSIEVRLFNPFVIRRPRIGYLTDFFRANRRMHNKSFTVDNQVTVIGGRNVGDEYFGAAAEGSLFVDFDVAAVGPVVTEVSRDFDRYWASASSYPLDRIVHSVEPAKIADVAAAAVRVAHDPAALAYITAIRDSPFIRAMVERRLGFEWAITHMISDDPAKGLGRAPSEELFHHQLRRIIGNPVSDLELVASYLVPGEIGTDAFVSMARRGVKIKILTNSLEASDVPAVYSGFAKRRKPLLEAGITLYEMRRLSPDADESKFAGPFGSSGSSLHAKTFSVDRSRFFVGSFNFDPRSRKLNTELGFVVDSPVLARRIEAAFHESIPANSYEVHLSNNGQMYWTEHRDGLVLRHDHEPGTSRGLRAAVWLLSHLRIEWLL